MFQFEWRESEDADTIAVLVGELLAEIMQTIGVPGVSL